MINYFRKDSSGLKQWQHMKGRPFNKKLAVSGESVCYLQPQSLGADKLDERWFSGIWCGILDEPGEHLLDTKLGMVRRAHSGARAQMREGT